MTKFIKAVYHISVLCIFFATFTGLLALFLILSASLRSPYFPEQEVLATCHLLKLSVKSDFCINPTDQTVESLKQIINDDYPAGSTSIYSLNANLPEILRYESGSCNDLRYLSVDFPQVGECKSGFIYYIILPIRNSKLVIELDKNALVKNYTIGIDPSS